MLGSRLQERNEDMRSDQDLIAAVNGCDAEAFGVLYARYKGWVANLAWRLTGDHHLAMDVLQETFLYLLRKFPGFRLSCQFKTFLYPVVRNLSIAARRKARRYWSAEGVSEELAESTAAAQPGLGEADEPLRAVLAGLPEAHREVLLLRFVDELSLQEIAEATRIPVGTVKSRLHHALATLREDDRTRGLLED